MAPAWRVLFEASHNPLYVTLFRFGRPSFDLRHTTQISSWHHRSSPYALLIAWMRVSTRSWHIGPYYPVAFDLPFTGRYPREFVHPGLLHTAGNTCANTHNTTGEKIYNQLEDGGEYNITVLVAQILSSMFHQENILGPDHLFMKTPGIDSET
ncbi:uncharacterized protein ARMOST_01517 [Armillaria ostoyae]|uniref:Uncharacterized protein n=1 Tax=Armillaria ostoyae TaxID=47428 RepID=A0A284QP67_ARMOS|nr:uncharacterized protein ARMOST_01517 [Armillaria ostoyae]